MVATYPLSSPPERGVQHPSNIKACAGVLVANIWTRHLQSRPKTMRKRLLLWSSKCHTAVAVVVVVARDTARRRSESEAQLQQSYNSFCVLDNCAEAAHSDTKCPF